MCGRMQFENRPTWRQLHEFFSIIPAKADLSQDGWRMGDMKPTNPVPIVAHRKGKRRLTLARWWLVPRYTRELDNRYHMFNARSDNLKEVYEHWKQMPHTMRHIMRSAYIGPFLDGWKCLFPVNGYYEFKDGKPYLFTIEGVDLFAVAGLWEWNNHIKTPEWPNGILSCTMITTEPNDVAAPIHDRMPAIIRPGEYEEWLSAETSYEHALGLLRPYQGSDLRVQQVTLAADDQMAFF